MGSVGDLISFNIIMISPTYPYLIMVTVDRQIVM